MAAKDAPSAVDPPDLWLMQYLCPSRHALAASPYDRNLTDPTTQEAAFVHEMAQHGLRHQCGICGSETLRFEHRKLPYTDWETALRALAIVEAMNIESRRLIEQTRGQKN